MRFQTIHLPGPNLAINNYQFISFRDQVENIVVVKEGFCWPAFLFSVVWAIFHRLWGLAFFLGLINLLVFLALFQLGADKVANMFCFFGVSIIFGYLANDFRRSKLKNLGYREQCIILAPTSNIAVRRFLNVFIVHR